MEEIKIFDRSNPLIKAISLILLIAFIAQDIAWADPQIFLNQKSPSDKLAASTFLRSGKAINKVSAKAIEYAVEEYSAIPRDKLDLACVRASLRNLLNKNKEWLAPHVSYSLVSQDGMPVGDEAPDNDVAEVVVKFAPGWSVRYFDPTIAKPQEGSSSPVAINDRLHKQLLTSSISAPNGPFNFSFGEGVSLRHMEVNNIIAFHKLTIAAKGKHLETEFYERKIDYDADYSYGLKIRSAANLLMEKSHTLFAKGIVCVIAAAIPILFTIIPSYCIFGGLTLPLAYVAGRWAREYFISAKGYRNRSESIMDDTTVVLVDIPSHLLLSGKDQSGNPFYQFTHIGRSRRVIYIPKKALRDMDIEDPRDMRQLATILNHDQVELDLMHKDNRIAAAKTYQEYESLLTDFHDTAKLEDPFGEAANIEDRIAGWMQMDDSAVSILQKEIDEKAKELEARQSNILDLDESKTVNRFSYIYDTASMAMQIGYAYEAIGNNERARTYYARAWTDFVEVVSSDIFILPIYAQLNVVRINTFEGDYEEAARDFKRLTNYEIGVPHPHTKYIRGSVRVVETHIAENVERWRDEVAALMRNHSQAAGDAEGMERAAAAIADITEATRKYLEEQEVFKKREKERADYGELVEELRRAILIGNKLWAATTQEELREKFKGKLPEEVERVIRETISPTVEMIPDADVLASYIDELEKAENILIDEHEYERKVLKPLFDLFASCLKRDFDGADEFIEYCQATMSAHDAYELRMQMNNKDEELLDKFSKIRRKAGTEDASIELYGLLLFYLTSDSGPYLRHLYKEFMQTRPVDEIAFARKGVSHHTRGDAIIYFYPKNLLFEGRRADARGGHRYGETGSLEDAKSSENALKIRRAIEFWKTAAENEEDLDERIARFEDVTSIVELDMKTSLLFSDPQHNVVRPVHSGRSRHRLYVSKHYLDSLDINNERDMKELAVWLNYGQTFLDIGDQMADEGHLIPQIQKALSDFTCTFFDHEDTGLLSARYLKERLASFMEEDFLIKYREVLLSAIKEEKEAEVIMRGVVEPGQAAPNEYKQARNSFGHLLYRYEGLGLHSRADKAYMQMTIATSVVQTHEGGITPCTDQIELVLTALRFARWDDFLKELRKLLTGKGYPRPIEKSELPILIFMLKGRFQSDLRHAIHAQKAAADPYSYPIVEKIEKEADKLLKEFSDHPFEDLGPQDVQDTKETFIHKATLSFIGKVLRIRYSPFFHAPVIEEIAKVGAPFWIFAALDALNNSLPSLNIAIFAGAVAVSGIAFIIAHLLNERAPPRSAGEAFRLFAAPTASAIAGGILSYVFFTDPLYAILSSMLAHLAINVVVWAARRLNIDIKYSAIFFPGAHRVTWTEVERIRELSAKWGLKANGLKNLEDVLKDPGAENVRRAILELLEGGTYSALSRFEMYKEKQRGSKAEFLGELVQAASCQRRIKSSKVIEMGPIMAGAEIDAVLEVDHKKYVSRSSFGATYDLPEGMYLMEGKVDDLSDIEYFISYMFDTKFDKYLRAAQELRKKGKDVSGIIFAVGGGMAKSNAEEFRKIFIELGESDDDIRAAGFDPEKFKVYIYLVPETIYEEGPKTSLTEQDIGYIDAVMKKPEADTSIPPRTLEECRTLLERSLLLFGLERIRSIRMAAHFREHGVRLVAGSYDINDYVKAILDLKGDIAEVEKDETLVMDNAFIVEDEASPVFEGNKTDRIRNPNLKKADFTLGQKTWGNFEMFISKDRSTVYVSSVEKGPSEYFSINMDIAAPHPLMYHSGDAHIALDASIPAASVGNGNNVKMARIIGILREAIGFREEVVKHGKSDYYWMDRLNSPGNALVSYDILAAHKIPHLMELVGPHAVIPDFYALDEENRLELLAEFGRHSPVVLGKKFAHGYHAVVSIPQGRKPGNEKFDVAEGLTLSASMSDKFLQSPAKFTKGATVIAEEFLTNLRRLAEEEKVRMPMPRSVTVEDSYGNMKIHFEIDPAARVITAASAVEMVRTVSQKDLKALFTGSESIIASRTGMMDISKVPPSKLLRYGYAKVVGSNGNFVIAPVKGMIQRPMPRNWVMGLPFTSLAVTSAGKRSDPDTDRIENRDIESSKKEVVFALNLPPSNKFDDDVRESEKIYEFLDGFEKEHRGKLGGLLEDVLEELIFNVMEHGLGGKLVIYMEKDASGRPEWLNIVSSDNGPGLPEEPDKLVTESLLASEDLGKHADDDAVLSDDGFEHLDADAYRGQGFARIAFDPDSVTIEYNGRKFSRVTNDKDASSWFSEEGESSVVSGTRFTLGFSLKYAAGDKAMPAPVDLVDRRPVEAGLLASSFVEYDMAVKREVNPDNLPLVGLYCASGADLSNFLLSTNATEGYFVSHYRGRFLPITINDLKECFERTSPEDYIEKWLSPYYKEKFGSGFAGTEFIYTRRGMIAAMAFELKAIGVHLSTVRIDSRRGRPVILFRWRYQNCEERDYSVTLVNADATKPGEYAADLAGVAIDVYYQRAPNELPFEYLKKDGSYIKWIYSRMKPGGYLITDDHAFDNNEQWYRDFNDVFPLLTKGVWVPGLWPIEWVILKTLSPIPEFNHEAAYYGWQMKVRQKPLDAEMIIDKIDDVVGLSKISFLSRIFTFVREYAISLIATALAAAGVFNDKNVSTGQSLAITLGVFAFFASFQFIVNKTAAKYEDAINAFWADILGVPHQKKGKKDPDKGNIEPPDSSEGFIRQGDRSLKIFEQNRAKIESEDATALYKGRVIALVEKAIAESGLVGREKEMLKELVRTLRMDSYKIHTFNAIAESEDDFFLGWNYLSGSRMFLASDIIAGLEARLSPSLADEYLLHEALCPVLGHHASIMLQQKLFPEHYKNELKRYWESPVKPYKGLLGYALRRHINILSARRNAVSDEDAMMGNIERASQFSQSVMSSCSEIIAQHCRIRFSRDFGSPVLRDRDVIWIDERLCAEDSYTPGGLILLAGALAYGATARFADSDLFERYFEEITAWSAELNVYTDHIAKYPGAEHEMRTLLARYFRSQELRAIKLIDLARDRAQKGALYTAGLFADEGINEIASRVSMDEEEFVSVIDLRPVQHRILAPCYVGLNQEIRKTVNPDGRPLVGLYAGAGADLSNFFLSTDCTDAYFVDKRAVDVMRLKDAHRSWMSRQMNNLYASTKYQYGYGQESQLFNKFMAKQGATVEMHLIEELRRMNVAKEDIWVETNAAGRTVLKFRWGYWGEKPKVRSVTFIPANIKKIDEYPQDLQGIFKSGIGLYYQRAGMTIAEDYHLFLGEIGRSLKPGAFMVTDDNIACESVDRVALSPDVYLNPKGSARSFTGDISPQTVEAKTWERIVLKPWDNRYGWKLAVRRKLSPGESAKGAYATSFEGRGLPSLSDLSLSKIHTLSKDDIASLIKIIEGHDDTGKTFDSVFGQSSTPEFQKLKATFLYMLRLSRANDKFKQLLLMALRSPPYGMDSAKGTASSNLEIPSMIFATSKNIPSDSARYFDPETGQAVIVFNEQFFNIDGFVRDAELSDAVLHVRAERLLHELSHDNTAGPLSKEVAEEAKIIAYVDVPLSGVTNDIGMQVKIDRLLKNRSVNRALHHSGRIFTLFPQWLKEKNNISSREFNIWLHIVRRKPLVYTAGPVNGKAFPALPNLDIVAWYFEEYRASQAEMAGSFRNGTITGNDIIDWVDRVIRPLKADFDITGIVEAGKPFTPEQAGLLGEKILKDVLIPHGLIVHQSAVASGIAAGLIVNTEMITTPAGRKIPLYTVRTMEGDFGQGTAFAEYIIMPQEIARESLEIAAYYAKMWRDHKENRRSTALFRYKKEYSEWIFMHLLGRTDADAAARLVRECDLAEEISHSDMQAFAEAVLARPLDTAVPEDVEAASHAILRPASIEELAFEAARDPETRYTLAEAVLEVEAKLNAIIRSPMSAYNFLEILHGNVVDLHIPDNEPPEYNVARNILLSVLSKHLFGKSTTDKRQWRDYLDESLWNIDEFNAALKEAAAAAYREEFLDPDERVKKAAGFTARRQQKTFFAETYREVVKPRFAPGTPKVLNICSGSNALSILYATNCSEAVMIDRLPFGYGTRTLNGASERIERERYFNDIAVYDFPRTDTLGGIGALWYPLKWELSEMGIGEDAMTIDNPASGMWRVRFTWQHPDDSQARERTLWFYEEDIPESYGIADLAMAGRFDEQGVNVLDADILFDKAAEHTLRATTDLPLGMKRKSIVITDNPIRKNIFDTQDSLVPIPLSPGLAGQSHYFGYVGKHTYEKRDALDAMAVYEVRGAASGFSGESFKIFNSAALTDEERDKAALFVIQEGLDISTTYIGDDARALELGRAYLDKLTRKNEGGESGYFVAFRGGKPVGIVSYAVLPEWFASNMEYESTIGDLYVTGNARHQGIAVALVRQAEMYLRKKNVKNYYVVVGQGALPQDFWKKFIPKEYQTLDNGGELLSSIIPFENAREISRLEACIDAVKRGALQKGNIVDLRGIPPEKEVILVGDLHARADLLDRILERKDPQTGKSVLEKVRDQEAILVLLGDVVHNDPPSTDNVEAVAKHLASMEGSVNTIKKVMDLKTLYPDSVYYLLGNHDDPFSTCLRGGIDQSKIYRETIRSRYGERYLHLYKDLIHASPVMVIAKGLVATHAAPIKELTLEEITAADKDSTEMHFGMWGRHESHFGDLVDISGSGNPLLELLYRSRKEQSYDGEDVRLFLERVGQDNGIFIVGHTPDLIPEGNFYAEIEKNHYIIYAARDKAGYASFKAGKLELVETSDVVQSPVKPSPGPQANIPSAEEKTEKKGEETVLLTDKVLSALPYDEQKRVDAVVRFAVHVIKLKDTSDADLEKEADFDDIPASTVAAFIRGERDKDAKLDRYDESWEADAIIFIGKNHPLFRDTKVTPALSIRVLYEMYKRGASVSEYCVSMCDSIDKLTSYLLSGPLEENERMTRTALTIQELGMKDLIPWTSAALGRIALYAEGAGTAEEARIARDFLKYFTGHLFESRAMADAFMFNLSVVEGFLGPGNMENKDTGVVYIFGGASLLYDQARQIAASLDIDPSRIHPFYLNRKTAESDDETLRAYIKQEGLDRYKDLVIVDTGFHGSMACRLKDVLGSMPRSPRNVHARLLALNAEPYEYKGMDVMGYNHLLQQVDANWSETDRNALYLMAHLLDNILPKREQSPGRLDTSNVLVAVTPVALPSEVPVFAAIVAEEMKQGTDRFLSHGFAYPDPTHNIWERWIPVESATEAEARDLQDKTVRDSAQYNKLKQELKTRFTRLARSSISVESVADVLDHQSIDVFQAMWELKNTFINSSTSDVDAQVDMCYEVSLAACEAFDEAMPGHEVVLMSGFYDNAGGGLFRIPHFWVVIDGNIAIDLTYGQFDSEYQYTALVARSGDLPGLNLEKGKVVPWKSAASSQASAASLISSIHDMVKVDASAQGLSKIVLSASLFDDIDRSNLERLFSGTNIEIVEPGELKRRAMNEHSSKENLAIVLTQEDFTRDKAWSGAEEDYRVKSSVLILEDKLTGSNYLYLEGVIELAKAMMRSDKNGIKEYYKIVSGIALSDEVLGKLGGSPNTIAFAINAILKFRPIVVHDTEELERFKSMVERYLVEA